MEEVIRKIRRRFYTPKRNYAFKFVSEIIIYPHDTFSLVDFTSFISRFSSSLSDTEINLLFTQIQENGITTKQKFLLAIIV